MIHKGLLVGFTQKDAIKLLIILISIEAILVFTYLTNEALALPYSVYKLIDLDGEANFPAWFTSAQLLMIGILFLLSRNWSKANQIYNPSFLLIIGFCFLYLSIDETAGIHESITSILKQFKWIPRFKGDHGIWIPLYCTAAILLLLKGRMTVNSFIKVYQRHAHLFLLGASIFVIGGVGIEIIGYLFLRDIEGSSIYIVATAFEELLEMVGVSIILYSVILCAISKD